MSENLIELMRKTWTSYKTDQTLNKFGKENLVTFMGERMGSVLLFIAELEAKMVELQDAINFHPRAWKLMNKQKRFVVVAVDEPYFMTVYGMIRTQEQSKGMWTETDEAIYSQAWREWMSIEKTGSARKEIDPGVEKDWVDFWAPIVLNPDGSVNLEQVKKELSDFRICIEEVSKAYDSITNGKFSKPTTRYEFIVEAVNEQIENESHRAMEEMKGADAFETIWEEIQLRVHNNSVDKGWWESERNDGEMLALMHSELSEALEGLRHGNPPSDHTPEFSAVEEEFADVIIRIMDYAFARNLNIPRALMAKMEFNQSRPRKHGGKKF